MENNNIVVTSEAEATPKKSKKGLIITLSIVAAVLVVLGVLAIIFVPKLFGEKDADKSKYEQAIQLIKDGEYEEAYNIFTELKDYEDSEKYLKNFMVICATEKEYDADGSLMYTTTYKYNEKTNTITRTDIDPEYPEDSFVWEDIYDDEGFLVRYNHIENGELLSYTLYEYDKDGNKIGEKDYDDGKLFSEYKREFDEYGNLVCITNYDESGNISYRYEYEYEYNDDGKPVSCVYYSDGNRDGYREYKYYEDGTLKTETYSNTDGEFSSTTEYNKDGKEIRYTSYYDYGDDYTEASEYTYEYDENGNLVLEKSYLDGDIEHMYKYEYDKNNNLIREDECDYSGETVRYYTYEDYSVIYLAAKDK